MELPAGIGDEIRFGSGMGDRTTFKDDNERIIVEHWLVHGAAHAWFGGDPRGSFTDPNGPDATSEMMRFFLERTRA